MAKKIVYDIVIESSDAQGSIKRVEDRLNELNQTANVSQKEINTLQQELKDLGQTNSDKAVEGVQSLRREYRRLTEELQRTEEGTEKFNELAQAAGQVKDRIDDAQDSIANFNKSPLENIRNNFSQLGQKIRALDFAGFNQSLKDLKVNLGNAATEFIGIQRGAGLAANGLKIFKAALIGTGILAVVAVIGTLIAEFDTLKESGGLVGNTFQFLSKVVDNFTTSVLKLSDALGLTENAYDKYIEKQKESAEVDKKEKVSSEDIRKAYIERQVALGNITAAQAKEIKTTEDLIKLVQDETQVQKDLDKSKQKQFDIQQELIKLYKELPEEIQKNIDIQNDLGAAQKNQEGADALIKKIKSLSDATSGLTDEQLKNSERITDENNPYFKQAGAADELVKKLNELNSTYDEVVKSELSIFELRKLQKDLDELSLAEREQSRKDALARELEDAEKKKNIQLDAANRRFLQDLETEESLVTEKENIEQRFLSEKLRINKKYGEDISAIQVQISDNLVNQEQERIKKLNDFITKTIQEQTIEVTVAPFTPEELRPFDVENANKKVGLLSKEIEQRGALKAITLEGGELEISNIQKSLELNALRLTTLKEYNLSDSQLYKDAINEKILLEAQLTQAIDGENQKRVQSAEDAAEATKKEQLELAGQVLNIASTLTNGISGLVNQRYDYEIERAGDNQEAVQKLQKQQFEDNKALGIVTAIISTAQAVVNALGTSGPAWVGIAMAAVVGALGAAQVAFIAQQEFNPGGGGGSSFNPNVQGSQTMAANVNAMQPNVNFAAAGSGANVQTAGGGSPNSVQFTGSISVSEINNTQQLVSIYETGSILGGG